MPCLFCIAAFALLAGAVTGVVLDELEQRLTTVASGEITRAGDSESTRTLSFEVPVPQVAGAAPPRIATAPVLMTIYKNERRARIQVRTHDVTRAEAEAVQDLVAQTAGLTVLSRASDATAHAVAEATATLNAQAADTGYRGATPGGQGLPQA